MTKAFRWRKAVMLSLGLHVLLLAAAGYLMSGLASTPPLNETLLEMELVNFPADRSVNNPLLPQTDTQTVPAEPLTPGQTSIPASEPEPVVAASDLTMTTAEPPSGQPETQTGGGSSITSIPASAASGPAGGNARTGIAAPGILSKVDPAYPPAARKAGLEGTVLLRIQILATGRPGDITVARSSGHGMLDEAAIAAVTQWRFIPAKDRSSGRTVTCITSLPVSFRLKNSH